MYTQQGFALVCLEWYQHIVSNRARGTKLWREEEEEEEGEEEEKKKKKTKISYGFKIFSNK